MNEPSTDRPEIPWPVFAATITGAFMVALDLSIVNVAFPSMSESFPEASASTLSWVLTAYSVVFGALLLGAGRIADRSGRKRWFMIGLGVFTLGSAMCAAAWSPGVLIVGRVVQAVGAALMMPTSLALLLAATPPESRAPTVAMWGGVTALGVAAGPSLGSLLVDAGGWRWAFLVNLPVALVAGVLARRSLTESAVGGPLPDVAGIGLITIGVASMALGITQGSEGGWGWSDPRTLAAFAIAVALVPVIIHRSRTQAVPALDLTLFAHRTVPLANAAALIFGIAFFGMLLSNVLFLRHVWGYSTLTAGLAITPAPLIVAALSRYTGRLSQRIGYRSVLLMGAGFYTAGLLTFVALVDTTPAYVATWLLPSVLIALGVAFTMPVLSAAAVAGLPQDRFAAGGAVNQTARQIGAVLGVAVLIAIVGDGSTATLGDFQTSWLVSAAAVIISGAISSFLPGRVTTAAPAVAPTPAPALQTSR